MSAGPDEKRIEPGELPTSLVAEDRSKDEASSLDRAPEKGDAKDGDNKKVEEEEKPGNFTYFWV
jgi:hypothetical protein